MEQVNGTGKFIGIGLYEVHLKNPMILSQSMIIRLDIQPYFFDIFQFPTPLFCYWGDL